ncbi:hypothetical protein HCH_02970 [Hahella chejuensis KCTC 2396]|uniref:Salt-induced outer membrane protein n=1 Tax=Hahella chejuensis (strain KCTC 2396) TaxID=349521 RepID=Q2SHY4_HAHCH|nr:DUF481 domain-containing protein [Hahella chejuensis]ABC29740.1 hypothetical protein HCH_02970 [Hahella chejuensis KCTC 2396]
MERSSGVASLSVFFPVFALMFSPVAAAEESASTSTAAASTQSVQDKTQSAQDKNQSVQDKTQSPLRKMLNMPDALTIGASASITSSRGQTDYDSRTYVLEASWTTSKNIISTYNQIQRSETGPQVLSDKKSSDNFWQYNFSQLYYLLAGYRYSTDEIQLVDREHEVFLAPGFYPYRTQTCRLSTAAGVVYLSQDYSETAILAGEDPHEESWRYGAYEAFDCAFMGKALSLSQSVIYSQNKDDDDDYRYRSMISAAVPMAYGLSVSVSYNVSYDNQPKFGVDKKQADLTTALSYKF